MDTDSPHEISVQSTLTDDSIGESSRATLSHLSDISDVGDTSHIIQDDNSITSSISLEDSTLSTQHGVDRELTETLRRKVSELDEENRKLRRSLTERTSQFDDQMTTLKHQTDLKYMDVLNKWQRDKKMFNEWQLKTKGAVDDFKAKLKILSAQRPVYLENLERIKNSLRDNFLVTTDRYLKINSLDDENQTLAQWVQLRVYEIFKSMKDENERYQKEVNKLSMENEVLQKTKIETDRLMKKNELLTVEQNDKLKRLITENSELDEKLRYRIQSYENYQHKERVFDETRDKAERYEKQVLKLQNAMELSERKMNVLEKENQEMGRKLSTVSQKLELITHDKVYLLKENEMMKGILQKNDDEKVQMKEKVSDLKRKKNELYDKLLSIKETSKTEYEESLQREIDKITERTNSDLMKIKENSQIMYQREMITMKEQRDEAKNNLEKLQMKYKEVEGNYERLFDEHKLIIAQSEKEMAQLNTQLKMKEFEHSRVSMALIGERTTLESLKKETEMLRKKVDVLRESHTNLEKQFAQESADLKSELKVKVKELNNYLKMEEALDQGIDAMGTTLNDQNEESTLQQLALVPTNHRRRLQYCLTLIRKVAVLEKDRETMNNENEVITKENAQMRQLCLKMEEKLKQASQPHDYLIKTIENKDVANAMKDKHILNLERQVLELKIAVKKLQKCKMLLEEDVGRLLDQNSQIKKLKELYFGTLGKTSAKGFVLHKNDPLSLSQSRTRIGGRNRYV